MSSDLSRPLDAHIDGPIKELDEYKRRRDAVQLEADQAQARLPQLEARPAQEPTAAAVEGLAALWSTMDVESRHEVAQALLMQVRVSRDKRVELRPRWADPVTVTFTRRRSTPVLSDEDKGASSSRGRRTAGHIAAPEDSRP